LLFLVSHCCCDSLIATLLSNYESAMNPPLAKEGPVQ
jgi:hypothetical protein